MPQKNIDLHGSAPDKHKFALLLIDVINDFDFPEADQLLKYARPMARNLLRLKRRAQKAGVPVVYVNDNFGRWKSDFRRTVEHCSRHGRGRDVVELLRPEENDYFVLKPKHSGFFSTTLETLLRYLETQRHETPNRVFLISEFFRTHSGIFNYLGLRFLSLLAVSGRVACASGGSAA